MVLFIDLHRKSFGARLAAAVARKLSLCALVASFSAYFGCSGDSGPVFPEGPVFAQDAPALFQLWVTYADTILGNEPQLIIEAMLEPGLVDGEVREVVDPALHVMGLELQADQDEVEHGNGLVTPVYRYGTAMAVHADDFRERPLTFTPPSVGGVQPDLGSVEWFGVARDGPDTIHLLPEEDLRLEVTSRVGSIEGPGLFEGGIVVLESEDARIPIRLPAYPENTIVIDREDLPPAQDGSFRARLRASTSRSLDRIPLDAYHIQASLAVELAWEVVVTD